MNKVLKSLGLAMMVGLWATAASAAPLTVYNTSSSWVSVTSAGGPATYVLPASTAACGSENEPACEQPGDFYFNSTWSGVPSYITLTEASGAPSDIVLFDSTGPGGSLRVRFFSDPTLANPALYAGYTLFTNANEVAGAGVVAGPFAVCCEVTGLSVVLASDGESAFQPFGVTFDTSDGIQFQGALDGGTVPEPASLVLLGTGLVAVVYRRRQQMKKA